MKGITYWFWIIASIIVGLLTFSLAYNQIYQTSTVFQEEKTLNEFESLSTKINSLCWDFVGNYREFTLLIGPEVEGVYASDSKHPKLSKKEIFDKSKNHLISHGKFICIQIKNKRVKCNELFCNLSMPYLSYSQESLTSIINKILKKRPIMKCNLELNRTEYGVNITLRK